MSAISRGAGAVSLSLGPLSVELDLTVLLTLAVVAGLLRGGMSAVVTLTGPKITAASRERQRRRLFESYLSADWATQSSDKTGRLLQTMS
ncbi:MAG: hypothetical protein LH624_13280, partial [Cryobacterium sp.]|nr:hypothetical protein [Cryobacterium sp.]